MNDLRQSIRPPHLWTREEKQTCPRILSRNSIQEHPGRKGNPCTLSRVGGAGRLGAEGFLRPNKGKRSSRSLAHSSIRKIDVKQPSSKFFLYYSQQFQIQNIS